MPTNCPCRMCNRAWILIKRSGWVDSLFKIRDLNLLEVSQTGYRGLVSTFILFYISCIPFFYYVGLGVIFTKINKMGKRWRRFGCDNLWQLVIFLASWCPDRVSAFLWKASKRQSRKEDLNLQSLYRRVSHFSSTQAVGIRGSCISWLSFVCRYSFRTRFSLVNRGRFCWLIKFRQVKALEFLPVTSNYTHATHCLRDLRQ